MAILVTADQRPLAILVTGSNTQHSAASHIATDLSAPAIAVAAASDWSMHILRMHIPAYLGRPRISHTYVCPRDLLQASCKSQAASCPCEQEGSEQEGMKVSG